MSPESVALNFRVMSTHILSGPYYATESRAYPGKTLVIGNATRNVTQITTFQFLPRRSGGKRSATQ